MVDSALNPLVYWPVAIAVGSWLFFAIAKRM